ncbi:MAG TPA: GNAT family N-acetyltransferase [Casimicrobiaceae bacterium]|nr:GNAT family N-acetyltransferase [Casimicrobiaceae bacterium]
MPHVELVTPSGALRDSYRDLVDEFVQKGETLVPFVLRFEHGDFDDLLARLDGCSHGIGLPDGFVPHSTYWMVEDGAHVVGVSNIRHTLTPALRREGGNIGYGIRPSARRRGYGREILRRSLLRAREVGLDEALLTCAKSNLASVSVIVGNGGVLIDEAYLPNRGEIVHRYVIRLGAS